MVGPAKSRRTQLPLQDWTLMKTVIDFTADELPTVGHATESVTRSNYGSREVGFWNHPDEWPGKPRPLR